MTIVEHGEEYLTAGEAARFLDVSPSTFIKFQKEYRLQGYRRPGQAQRKFFRKSDLAPILKYSPIEDDKDGK